jgi:hypothetical protein
MITIPSELMTKAAIAVGDLSKKSSVEEFDVLQVILSLSLSLCLSPSLCLCLSFSLSLSLSPLSLSVSLSLPFF